VTERSAIVLDGASAFDRHAAPADDYVDALLGALVERVDSSDPLPVVLADAIRRAVEEVHTKRGTGPSSTVAIVREAGESVEVAVLGDSTVVIGLVGGRTERITDDRMSRVASSEREHYRRRLHAGAGYDEHHRATLGRIQSAERSARNQPAGYWIAEANPDAAHHAVVRCYPRQDVLWCVLATDGAQRGIDHHGIPWSELPSATTEQLRAVLDDLHRWEADDDPAGTLLPRAKRHDDKALVTWSPTPA
jgi:hypothetical protein